MTEPKYKSFSQCIFFSITISLGTLNTSYCMSYLNSALTTLDILLNINDKSIEGAIVSSLNWAALFGAIITFFLMSKLKRR